MLKEILGEAGKAAAKTAAKEISNKIVNKIDDKIKEPQKVPEKLEWSEKPKEPNIPEKLELPEAIETDDPELTIEEKQEIADKTAQEYNAKTNPYERAVKKDIDGIIQTKNGGVSFAETDAIYVKEDGTKCIVNIEAEGNRIKDFDKANKIMGLEETPDGYVWHHLDDYNVKYGTITLELVKDEVHNATKPHSGGCAQYDSVNGPSYNPPKKGAIL